jgi:glyoxylase-like metal-dependent hydrolase (beta-lactamase superfamily II)
MRRSYTETEGGLEVAKLEVGSFENNVYILRERLFTLPDAATVCPGHGRDTTIGAERPSLEAWVARGW